MRKTITEDEFVQLLESFSHSAWRFEQQRAYVIDYEEDQFAAFVDGDPRPPTENPGLAAWLDLVKAKTSAGKTVSRVRIVDEPMTDYQRWLQWVERWNREAGEDIQYTTRAYAERSGLLPCLGGGDCWLLDDSQLVLFTYDDRGAETGMEVLVDEPELAEARRVRELATAVALAEQASVGPARPRAGIAPPVVFVAQLGTGGDSWKPVLERLPGVHAFTYDRPGTGSAPPRPAPNPPLPPSAFGSELAALLESKGLTEPAVIVGHSFGGHIARMYAARHPDRVAGLVLVDASIPQFHLMPNEGPKIDGNGPDATEIDTVSGHVEILSAQLPDVPAVVLARTHGRWSGTAQPPHPAVEDLWQVSQRILARDLRAPLIIADDCGHQLPRDVPDLVAYAVQVVLEAARAGRRPEPEPSALDRYGGHLAA